MAAQDLTTLSDVRAFMQKAAPDTSQDPVIQSLITRASDTIMRYTGREFAPATSSAARTFAYDGSGHVDLAPYDLRSITQVRMDTDTGSPVTLDTTEYRAMPLTSKTGVYTRVLLNPTSGHPAIRFADRTVEITGAWGFATVPEDVEHACILAVVEWMRSEVSAFTSTYAEGDGSSDPTMSLPQSARAVLWPWMRAAYV